MSRSKRKTEETYYDLLKMVEFRLEFAPLSLSELGLLFYILQACNRNYGNQCTINLRVVSAKCLSNVRYLPNKLQALAEKGYIKFVEVEPKVCQVTVISGSNDREQQDISPFSGARQDKTRQDNEDKNINNFYKNINEVDSPVFGQRKLPNNNTDETSQKNLPRFYEGLTLADL